MLQDWLAQRGIHEHLEAIRSFTRRRNWKRPPLFPALERPPQTIETPEPIIIAPEIIKYKPPKPSKRDQETQVIVLGDGHAGRITPSYNPDVYKGRMENVFQSMLTITNLHRHMYPINDLVIIGTGDHVQGENPYQGSKVESVAMGARNQIIQLALPAWLSFILTARENFKTVTLYGVGGNHGRYDRMAPETSNWDLMLYDQLKYALAGKGYDGITIDTSDDYYQIVRIQGHRFFIFHGDQVRASQGIPLFAQKRRLSDWYIQYRGFRYAVGGHWHFPLDYPMTASYELIQTGTLVSDDSWALARIGISSLPAQYTFGVHEKRVTWRYPLELEV